VPIVTRGDLELAYRERGDAQGKPIVLMHGLMLSSHHMERLARLLREYRVVLLDLHGHGRSSHPRDHARYSMHEWTLDVVALLDALHIERAAVGGMSLGANVTYQLALEQPDRLAAMILEMPVFGRGEAFGRRAFTALSWLFQGVAPVFDVARPLTARVPVPKTWHEVAQARELVTTDHRALAAMLGGLVREEMPPHDAATLAAITVPTLVIGHRGDPLHVVEDAYDVAQLLPEPTLVLRNTFFDFRVRPDLLAAEIRAFLHSVGW
jgi:pimeloyl-ACP methyl ester carboxylesterase